MLDIDDIINESLGLPREKKPAQTPAVPKKQFAFEDPMRELPRLGVQPQPNLPMSISPPRRLSTDMTMGEMEAGSKLAEKEMRRKMMTHMPQQGSELGGYDRTGEELLIDMFMGGDTRKVKKAMEMGEPNVYGELREDIYDPAIDPAFYGTDALLGFGIPKALTGYGRAVAKTAGSPEALTGALKKYTGGAVDIQPMHMRDPADLKTKIDDILDMTDDELPAMLRPQSGDGQPDRDVWYHGTDKSFDEFATPEGIAGHFTKDKSVAEGYGDRVVEANINIPKDKIKTIMDEDWRMLRDKPELIEKYKRQGYEAVESDDTGDIIPFYPKSISQLQQPMQKQAGFETSPVITKQQGEFYEVENAVQPVSERIRALQDQARAYGRRPAQGESAPFQLQTGEAVQRADLSPRQTIGSGLIDDEQNFAKQIGQEYQRSMGIEPTDLSAPDVQSSIQKQAPVAATFEAMPRFADDSPQAMARKDAVFETYPEVMPEVFEQTNATTYNELIKDSYDTALAEVKEQFKTLPVKMKFHKGTADEYKNSNALRDDIRNNNTMNVYQGGEPHEFWNELDPETGLTGNEMFRAVHDYYGHGTTDNQFGRIGEERATAVHGQMFSPLAKLALMAETRGQNSWVNYSNANLPMRMKQKELREAIHNAERRGDDAAVKDLKAELKSTWDDFQFAEQKAILLPAQMVRADFDGIVPEKVRRAMTPEGLEAMGTHYSTQQNIRELDPTKYGTGSAGRERSYAENLPDEMKPVHFYTPESAPEAQVVAKAKSMTQSPLKGLYDLTEDSRQFRDLAKEYSKADPDEVNENLYRQIHGAGYEGFKGRDGVAVAFGKRPVQKVADLEGMTPAEKMQAKPNQGSGQVISSRFPTAVRKAEDPLKHSTHVGYDSAKADPKALKHNMDIVKKYDNWRPMGARGAEAQAEQFIDHMKNNILFLHDKVPEDHRLRTRLWYDGANKIANRQAKKYGLPVEAVAGVYAALSPQKDWYMNVSLGDRVMNIFNAQQATTWSDKLDKTLDLKFPDKAKNSAGKMVDKPANVALKQNIRGKELRDLTDDKEIAMWIRNFDEAYGDRRHKAVTPEGEFGDWIKTSKGEYSGTGWGSLSEISKAVSALRDQSVENISAKMGNAHKVRSFYNNIVNPNAPEGFATVDTHAVSGNLMQPYAGTDTHVQHNFGSGGGIKNSSVTGNQGIYGLHHEALRRAAEERDLLPREMQSITWEAVRGLFNNKSPRVKKAASQVWKRYKRGEIEQDEAQELIFEIAGGINEPTWLK